MAAYETFAGGTAPKGATSMRGEFRGGGVRIDEIPNLPKVDPTMPKVNYPDVNLTARYDYQNYLSGAERRAAALQQEPLPGGFAKAAAITSAAAGEGEYRMGAAISKGSAGISDALMTVSQTISDIQREAADSKDSTDKIRWNNLKDHYDQQFEYDMTKQNVPVQEWPDRWKSDYEPQLLKDASGLGVNRGTRDNIQADAVGFSDRMHLKWAVKGAQVQRQEDMDVSTASFNDSLEHQDWQGASEANDNLFQHDYISRVQHQENKWKIENAQNKQVLATQVSADPDYMLTQIDRIENPKEGKPPADPEFQFLKNDAISRKQAKEAAQEEKNSRETEAERKFVDGVASGEIKPENISEEGQKAKLRPSFIKTVEKDAKEQDPEYNPRVATRLNTDIDSYNWHDYPGEKETLARYHQLKEQIFELPKVDRADYNQRLDKRLDDLRAAKKQTLSEERVTSAKKYIDTLDDSGYFGPDGTVKDKEDSRKRILPKDDPVALATYRDHYAKIEAMKSEVEKFVKEKNPSLEELQEKVGKLTQQYGVGAMQNLKPFTAEEYKDAGAPPSKGPTLQERADAERERAKLGTLHAPIEARFRQEPVASFSSALGAPGERMRMTVTAYTPGKGDLSMEGPNKVSGRRTGPAYTYEQYKAGTVPWVSVAMDPNSPLQGKFLVSPNHPNVVFKVEDTGPAFEGKGNSAIDIAFSDKSKGVNYGGSGAFRVISEADANSIAAEARGQGRIGASGTAQGRFNVMGVNPTLTARFNQIQQMWGQKLDVISGYRSVAHNRAVGGASGSLHTHGNAIDVATGHLSHAERLQLIQIAVANGITGIGVYANNLHFDIGPRRAWGPSYHADSIPDWARPTLKRLMLV